MPDVSADVIDDGRRWWVVGAKTWTGTHLYEAPAGRNALAAYRRDLIAADHNNGFSLRHATEIARAAQLHVVAGPLTTVIAYQNDLGQALADEACRWTDYDLTAPIGPILPDDMAKAVRVLGIETVERIRQQVLARYTKAKSDA
jgi:hypothetical protein